MGIQKGGHSSQSLLPRPPPIAKDPPRASTLPKMKTRLLNPLLFAALSAGPPTVMAAPIVRNRTATQRVGTQSVNIGHDVAAAAEGPARCRRDAI
jgi:hypothetical protein